MIDDPVFARLEHAVVETVISLRSPYILADPETPVVASTTSQREFQIGAESDEPMTAAPLAATPSDPSRHRHQAGTDAVLPSRTNGPPARYSLESLIQRIADAGISPGVEVVGASDRARLPEGERRVRPHMERTARPVRADAVLSGRQHRRRPPPRPDAHRRRDRRPTSPARWRPPTGSGSPPSGRSWADPPPSWRRLLHEVEHLGIKMEMEVHPRRARRTELVQRTWDAYEDRGPRCSRFIPDFGSTVHALPEPELA
ncbi:hypothetical protein ACRAWF_36675 [Streptomyces sp. L7]